MLRLLTLLLLTLTSCTPIQPARQTWVLVGMFDPNRSYICIPEEEWMEDR